MYIGDPCQAENAHCKVETIMKGNFCENQENVLLY